MKMKITVKKNMMTGRFADLASATEIKLVLNPVVNIPYAYIGDVDKKNAAGQVILAVSEEDNRTLTMQELTELLKKPHTVSFVGVNGNQAELSLEMIDLVKKSGASLLQQEIDRVVSEGIFSKEETDVRVNLLKDYGCSENLMEKVFRQMHKYDTPIRTPKTIYQDVDGIMKKAIVNALKHNAVIYEGEKSVGKNVCAETLAWLLGMPYYLVSLSKKTTLPQIAGERTTKASDLSVMSVEDLLELQKTDPARATAIINKGQTVDLVTEESELTRWLRGGGVIMFNEINMADANMLQELINPLADGTGFVTLPGHGRIFVHPDCVLLGSQNAGYIGAQAQNNATMSRFGRIAFPYPEHIEKQLMAATEGLGIKKSVYKNLDELYRIFRESVHNGSQSISDMVLNIRGFVRALETWAEFPEDSTLCDCLKEHVAAWVMDDERSIVETYINDRIGY